MKGRAYIEKIGLEGVLMVLAPLPLFFVVSEEGMHWLRYELLLAALSSMLVFGSALTLLRRPLCGRALGIGAVILGYLSSLHFVLDDQAATLAASVIAIAAFFAYFDFSLRKSSTPCRKVPRAKKRAVWGNIALLPVLILNVMFSRLDYEASVVVMTVSVFIAFGLYMCWAVSSRSLRYALVSAGAVAVVLSLMLSGYNSLIPVVSCVLAIFLLFILPHEKSMVKQSEQWWEVLINHPARMLLTTFCGLCVFGSLLLMTPFASAGEEISVVDAVFTSVSAVCVTGLIVLDTPIDFSVFGQCSILLLIQLGGLGIMSITTVALHAMGRRLSLRQEKVMTSMTDTPHRDLINSLALILKYTFIIEGGGMVLLSLLFYLAGDSAGYALYRGVFTAVSAFCNAGFALQSNSLVPYQSNPLILHVVALLIILGGIAPASVLFFPRWLRGKPTPLPARLALIATVILLVVGMLVILIFEWNGFLSGLGVGDKVHNAWFQSVTLRTAGFNSVSLERCASPTYLLMVMYMFVGGSPGGTAGGIKTTTAAVLVMTFLACIMNRRDVITQNRRVDSLSIYRAITIVISGMIIWFASIIMLEVTQQIPAKDLIFEVTSALGTVGLTIGATPMLDAIGKLIVVMVMFAGRVGPMTLFMLLSDERESDGADYIDEKITLT